MNKLNIKIKAALYLSIILSLCFLANTATTSIGGLVTDKRPEVGIFNSPLSGGTATLIHQRFILTAAHCNYGFPVLGGNTTFRVTAGSGHTYNVERLWTFGSEGPLFAPSPPNSGKALEPGLSSQDANGGYYNVDLMLARLTTNVPATVASPAFISDVTPLAKAADHEAPTLVSTFGYGMFGAAECKEPGDGKRRYRNWNFDKNTSKKDTLITCPGDSGGPSFMGKDTELGPIWSVTSFINVRASAVRYKEEIYAAMQEMEGTRWVAGTDRPGATYATKSNISTVNACELECIKDTDCRAWSYDPNGKACNLKSKITTWTPSASLTSGIRPRFEVDVDRNGSDLFTFMVPDAPDGKLTTSAAICAGACGLDSRCASYTYANKTCYLKNGVPKTSTLTNAVSGVKLPTEPNTDRGGGDYDRFTSTAAECANRCAKDSRCLAYTFAGDTCYLKESVPYPTLGKGLTSGIKRPLDLPGVILEGPRVDGFSDFSLDTPHPEACRALCNSQSSCIAFVYQQPLTGLQARCRLIKDKIVTITPNQRFYTSGLSGLTFF